ncbi:phosphoadenosine phosphosulfate reductase [Streptomyces diastaticus subsp. diastaticus]|uniref:Phosphoadenosine phosphosulfate reductase n=2 Tax=Streptomyces TaxID=1883 RepID=A0ABQ1CV22_STRDI|nr:phosphoadenosine phosphosulfate reductase [Streptomyces diastaticus subsp. diastaticus]GGU43873.1 phosphoadenosine phosphosulfate reductase [Streptomyces diastaticus subsp. diastaticus]
MAILQHTLGDHHVDPTDPLLKAACSEPNRRLMKVISYGGGVQSTALLVLAARREIDFRTFLFANVGDDSEHPATLAYVREIAIPYAMRAGLDIHELKRRRRDGASETLMQRLNRPDTRSIPIPVRMANGAPGRRNCTADFKIKVVGRWLREHGATAEEPAAVGIGISVDEIHRANRRRREAHEDIEYPLLDLGLRRDDCERIIAEAGLPVPPKSSCFFCPFRTVGAWRHQRRHEPELFAQSVRLEETINRRRAALGRDAVYLTRYGIPLTQAIPDESPAEGDADENEGACDSGWCMT